MLTRSRISRLASAGALVLAAVTLSSCGFNYATDKVYTPAEGVNNRDSRVDVLNAAIVATEDGKGTFVASLSNNETPTSRTASSPTSTTGSPAWPGSATPP